jgi:alpha-galactosidase/6-phospho-beta-glucosidase family protein
MLNVNSPYVYLGTHPVTGQFYIGVRYANQRKQLSPELDLGIVYFTTSKVVKPIFNQFKWEILAQFITKEDALEFEEYLISIHWKDPLLLNKNKGGKRFHRPDVYIRKPKDSVKKGKSKAMQDLWQNEIFRNNQIEKRKQSHSSKEFRENHSKVMKAISQQSKNICRVCRLSDRKEMTIQNFFRYL